MMNIAMAKAMVAMVETTGSAGRGIDEMDVERGIVASAAAEAGAPVGPVVRIWRKLRDRAAPAVDMALVDGRGAA